MLGLRAPRVGMRERSPSPWLVSLTPAQALDSASVALRGPARTAVADHQRRTLLAGRCNRRSVLIVEHGERCARPLLDESDDDDDALSGNGAGPNGVAESHRVGWLRTRAVDPDVPGLAGCCGSGPRWVEANRPEPGIDTHARRCGGSGHGPSLGAGHVGRAGDRRVVSRDFPCINRLPERRIDGQNARAKSTASTMSPRTKMMAAATMPTAITARPVRAKTIVARRRPPPALNAIRACALV